MTEKTTKAGVPTRDFSDAGTGESFTANKPHNFEAGAHANYLHAGLIVELSDEKPSTAEEPAS